MRVIVTFILAIFVAWVLFLACSRKHDKADAYRLAQWDALCDSLPEAIKDSLDTMNPHGLSSSNRAWHGLLKTIADDKTYIPFTSDSLINSVELFYRHHDRESHNHVRALIYQGVVRVRMDVTDSMAYGPLKKALAILYAQKDPDLSSLYFASSYMGYIHDDRGSGTAALHYYQEALKYAGMNNNISHLFDGYLKLFWLQMSSEEYDRARLYLDTLAIYSRTPDDNYYLLNAEAVYFDEQGEYGKVLQKEREQLSMMDQLKNKPAYYRVYYSFSDCFDNLNQLDSALYYARKAIEHIENSSNPLNWLLYGKAADIAVKMGDYRLAEDYRRQALEAYDLSVKDRLDIQINELEKKYDLAEVENRALKAKNRFRITLALFFFGALFMIIFILYIGKQRTIAKLRQDKLIEEMRRVEAEMQQANAEKHQAEAEYKLSCEQTENQRQILFRYDLFLKFHARQQQDILGMSNKIRAKDLELGDAYDDMLKEGQRQFNLLLEELFADEEMKLLLDIKDSKVHFNGSDRLILFMLVNNANNSRIAGLLRTCFEFIN
uniref:tetratricopeptide repeat protein n=1 Tax=Proteiniphilum sp. UBA5384 TaxID=1947279 RepID=UPI0025FB2C09